MEQRSLRHKVEEFLRSYPLVTEFCGAAVLGAMCAGVGVGVGLRVFGLPEAILLGVVGAVVGGFIGFIFASILLTALWVVLLAVFPSSSRVRAAAVGLALIGALIQYSYRELGFWETALCFGVYLILSLIVCEGITGVLRMARRG